MDNQTKAVLIKARALIIKGWTQGEYARTKTGQGCLTDSPWAARYCAQGAILRADADGAERLAASKVLRSALRGADISSWNDHPSRTKQDVLNAFDKAIASCE